VATIALLLFVIGAGSAVLAQPADLRSGLSTDSVCATLLDARSSAESQGRIDFSAIVEWDGGGQHGGLRAHIQPGSPYRVGRIEFNGHGDVNDSTLRRAFTMREREVFDVGELRRSLAGLNGLGLTEPLTLADVVVTRHPETGTADLTIPLRKKGRRWWSLSAPIIPGLGSYEASISSRLPAWGRGVFDVSTYVVTFNLLALAKPTIGILKFLSKAPAAVVMIERPVVPGQEWWSGFALSPTLSAHSTIAHYGRTQLGRGARAILADNSPPPLAVPIAGKDGDTGEFLVCEPPKSRWRWFRRGAVYAIDFALAAALP
jgi:hypothetical protein